MKPTIIQRTQPPARYIHVSKVEQPVQDIKKREITFRFSLLETKERQPDYIWDDGRIETAVNMKKLPAMFSSLEKVCPNSDLLGYMSYHIKRTKAITAWYYPKVNAANAPGFGVYLEFLATNHLKKNENCEYMRTSLTPSKFRRKQVRALGLPIFFKRSIEEWMQKLALGLKHTSEKYNKRLSEVA
ncbi:MAG: hypothetical protein NTV88_04125 [Candidatus Micrarchaeota archaeon]|nr:hypothetical protein [Candidatus Micrarchaeota archaeon]